MNSAILMAHSGWRYIVLLLLLVAIVKYLVGWLGSGRWSNLDTSLNRFTPIALDIQWLLGLIVWIVAKWWANSDSAGKFEHPLAMTAGVIVAHLVSARVRKAGTDRGKYTTAFWGYLITLIVIILGLVVILEGFNIFGTRV